jgi:ubiquinone/menaquinone biosynthesis C-methylase UbiE
MEHKDQLSNNYVREYYNKTVKEMEGGYTKARWFSSVVGVFDHTQTKRALEKALGDATYETAIEIGPGDAVWTMLIKDHVSKEMHLIEQSDEMLAQAKKKLQGAQGITFEHSDFLASQKKSDIDLIVASRCFEYFDDKQASAQKIYDCLAPNGKFILITKNSKLFTTKSAQGKLVHSDQLSKKEAVELLQSVGFHIEYVFPAVMRWKIKFAPMRWLFDALHKLSVSTSGRFKIPVLESRATESYVYIAVKPSL